MKTWFLASDNLHQCVLRKKCDTYNAETRKEKQWKRFTRWEINIWTQTHHESVMYSVRDRKLEINNRKGRKGESEHSFKLVPTLFDENIAEVALLELI